MKAKKMMSVLMAATMGMMIVSSRKHGLCGNRR